MKKTHVVLAVIAIIIVMLSLLEGFGITDLQGKLKIGDVKKKVQEKIEQKKQPSGPTYIKLDDTQARYYTLNTTTQFVITDLLEDEEKEEYTGPTIFKITCEHYQDLGPVIEDCLGVLRYNINNTEQDYAVYPIDYNETGFVTYSQAEDPRLITLKLEPRTFDVLPVADPQSPDPANEDSYIIDPINMAVMVQYEDSEGNVQQECYQHSLRLSSPLKVYGSKKALYDEKTGRYYAGDFYIYDEKGNKIENIPVKLEEFYPTDPYYSSYKDKCVEAKMDYDQVPGQEP